MDSALSPREIQARIRSGESLEEVAEAAGMSIDWVEPFAAPVIAEREFIAGQAQARPVRRGAETIAHRTLSEVVNDRLSSRKIDLASVQWDAWKHEARRWRVRVEYDSGRSHREALFTYDAESRFSVAENDDARWLLGLHSSSHGPQPGKRRREDDAEPTVGLNDDLALVRVVQPRADDSDDPGESMAASPREAATDDGGENEPIADDLDEELDDAYAEGELTEVNGVYDIVPSTGAGLDVLYDMLSSFDEDSVQIYAGLIRPEEPSAAESDPMNDDRDTGTERDKKAPPKKRKRAPATPKPVDPEQPSLVDEEAGGEATPRPKRKRASVPSWDEIIFGAPKEPKKR